MTIIPAMFMLPAIYMFWKNFPMRSEAQRQKLDESLKLHREGKAAADPYYVGSVVHPVGVFDNGARLVIGDSDVSGSKARILRHFFPSELQSVLATSSFESLKTKMQRRIALASIFVLVGLFLAVTSFFVVAASTEDPQAELLCIGGGTMFAVGALFLWFDGTRYIMACKAVKQDITSDEVQVVLAIFQPAQGKLIDDQKGSGAGVGGP